MSKEEPFTQLYLRFTDPVQYDYEVIRPVVLFSQPISDRSKEADVPRTTVSEKAKRFVQQGMFGLADRRSQPSGKREIGFPEPIAQHILYLKHLYPPINNPEIVRILGNKFGYRTHNAKVKRFLERNPIPVQLELKLEQFHEFDDAYEARWTVVRMFHEGWNKKSIAAVLKLSRRHVTTIVKTFDEDGFEGLEDKRARPAHHPFNQMTLPFMETVFRAQLEYPDAGRFRIHGILEQKLGDDLLSERTVGRAMKHNRFLRGAPNPLKDRQPPPDKEPIELPYLPRYHHQYWFIDIRYLVKFDGEWVYSICIVEGISRTILAGMVSEHQDTVAILQLLHAAVGDYGTPWGIVSDNAKVFTSDGFLNVLDGLEIQPCPIEPRQSWQNLIESQFNVQRRLGDAKFKQAETLAELQDQHAMFIQLFNTTNHWAHRERVDDKLTPIAVLDGRLGRLVTPEQKTHAFRHTQYSRVINRHGCLSVQRFYIYAERGLAKHRVSVWLYQGRLNIEYHQTVLSRYRFSFDRKARKMSAISHPDLYKTAFTSPQIEMFELDDEQWKKILRRPEYKKRKRQLEEVVHQLAMELKLLLWFVT